MAPHAVTNGSTDQNARRERRIVTVLVTGFGPFQERYPINPSYEIAKSLPSKLSTSDTEIHIIAYGTPIRVSYEEVRKLVPLMHESYSQSVDLVLHMGMASGRTFYTAEMYGHRDGYVKNKDLDGNTLPADDGIRHFGDCPAMMTTSLDYDDVYRKWQSNLHQLPTSLPAYGADCRASEDAGHYLCDYIYFNSLACSDGGKFSDRPVMFLHVPAETDQDTLEKGQQITVALIKAMADHWSQSVACQ
ncbi:hypothetical protein LTR37_018766 [Vermiconidia calcicola]|uniref:Uncharacterized protein n=1 Tax=Vermiconidia calcicola TaxID=1690605 RepID=A0ACC3MJ21_9PEZI|nr:hypothetical protein LTR37_018766 [Vermiconidia calcicola]